MASMNKNDQSVKFKHESKSSTSLMSDSGKTPSPDLGYHSNHSISSSSSSGSINNLCDQTQPASQTMTNHSPSSLPSPTTNIYATIGQSYATDNSGFGPIYHSHHYGGYSTPYDKLKGHMRQVSTAYGGYSPFYGSSLRPNSYIDLGHR